MNRKIRKNRMSFSFLSVVYEVKNKQCWWFRNNNIKIGWVCSPLPIALILNRHLHILCLLMSYAKGWGRYYLIWTRNTCLVDGKKENQRTSFGLWVSRKVIRQVINTSCIITYCFTHPRTTMQIFGMICILVGWNRLPRVQWMERTERCWRIVRMLSILVMKSWLNICHSKSKRLEVKLVQSNMHQRRCTNMTMTITLWLVLRNRNNHYSSLYALRLPIGICGWVERWKHWFPSHLILLPKGNIDEETDYCITIDIH